ncbi:hypothetical protein ACSSS7_004504 [Eimeria intestinalis]
MATLANWGASSSSSSELLSADHEAEHLLLLQSEKEPQDSLSWGAAGGVSPLHVRKRRTEHHRKQFNPFFSISQLILAAVAVIAFLVLRCMNSFKGGRTSVLYTSRRLAVGGEDPCGSGSGASPAVQQEEAPADLETRGLLLLQQLSLSAADSAALTEDELRDVKAAKRRLARLQQNFIDWGRNTQVSQQRLARHELLLQQASSLSALGCRNPYLLRWRRRQLEQKREKHGKRMKRYQRATAALMAVATAPKQLVKVACIQANSYACNRGLTPAAAAALAAADIVKTKGSPSSGVASLATLTNAERAALPLVLRSLQRKAEGLCRQLWLARLDEETEGDGSRVLQEARVFIEQIGELLSGWAEAGLDSLPAGFAEAVERLEKEAERSLKAMPATQQREEQQLSRPSSQTALASASSSGSTALPANLEAQALHQLLLLSPQVSPNLSEEDNQRIEKARQRLAELLQLSNQKKVLQARISNALIRAAEAHSDSTHHTSEEGSPGAQAAQPPEEGDLLFYEAWLAETGREAEAAEQRLQAAAFHPQQEAFALLEQVQRQLGGSDPPTFDEARALVAAEVVHQSLKPFLPPPPPTDSERQAIFNVVSAKKELLAGLSASDAGALATEEQIEAAEATVDEVETVAAAVRLLLGREDAAAAELVACAAAVKRQLQEAREELEEAAKRQAMKKWIERHTVEAAALSRVLERGWFRRVCRANPMQLEALILDRVRVLEQARQYADCPAASSEERHRLGELCRLTEMQLEELVRRMERYWTRHSGEITDKLQKAIVASRDARVHLPPAPASEASSQGQQQQRQQQQSDRQSRKVAAAARATLQLLETQRAIEEELEAFTHIAEVRLLSAEASAAADRVKVVVGQADEEAARAVASVVEPLKNQLICVMERLAQLDAMVEHRVAGLSRARMLINFGIDPNEQYGLFLREKRQLEDEVTLLLRVAEALLEDSRIAGAASPNSLQELASVVDQAKDYGVVQS